MSGFKPGSPAHLWVFSEPRLLGEFTTDTNGGLEAALAVLPSDLSACQHTVQVVSALPDGRRVAASLGVWVQPKPYPFSDLTFDSVHGPGVGCMASLDIVDGYGDGTFRPGDWISRGQMATFLARAAGLELQAVPTDAVDVADGTHGPAIAALRAIGIVQGYADGTFGPDDRIRRDQMASLISRLLEHLEATAPTEE